VTVSRYIYKYAVMPLMGPVGVDGRPVFFGVQGTGCLYVWCEVSVMDSDGYKRPMYPKLVTTIGTGMPYPDNPDGRHGQWSYVDSAIDGEFVWHLLVFNEHPVFEDDPDAG
jgi:hypothetical protein